jgi:Fe(3+) dicitrate transport protein
VAGAKVHAVNARLVAWTDATGEFVVSNAPAGEIELRFLDEAYEPVAATVRVPAEGDAKVDVSFTSIRGIASSIEVIGRADEVVAEIPGSTFVVGSEELQISRPMDANEVMRRIPGVTLREDSGPVAMRLNVALRGLNPDRSRQVLMLEDGLPISLAPYGEPEMYYSPPIDRMERVEVLKGSGQILYGPQTVGGVINFVTPDPPQRFRGDLDVAGGQRGFFTGRAQIGGSTEGQKAGWLASYLHKEGDGWRQFFFDVDDVQTKFTLKPDDRQTLALKLGVYDERSNSTYLGLTQPMFDQDPNQNAVPGDDLAVSRQSGSLLHTLALSPQAVLSSSVFAYHTVRNWGRTDFDRGDQGRNYLAVFGDPSIAGGAVFLRNSSGNRNREFTVAGAQTGVAADHGLFGVRSRLDAGFRYVYEEAQDQHINGETYRSRTGVLRDDEDRFGRAFSAYVQNRFRLGERLTVTPGVRFERYSYERFIQRTRVGGIPTDVDRRNENVVTKAIPGLGAAFKATSRVSFFAGVHRGFAPPRIKDAITGAALNLELDAELSWNYEAGVRYIGSRAVRGEFTWFRLDFENQIIPGAQSGGAVTTLVNAGETLNEGVEASLRVNWSDLADLHGWDFYTDVRHMHLATARFTRNALFEGNRLPYAPKDTFSFLVGLRQRRGFGVQLDMSHIGEQFGDNNETVQGSADGTVGLLPSYQVFNLMIDYTVRRERFEVRPYFTVKNLTDELYIASRAPQGIQPGMFRQVNAGLKFSF